MNKKVRILAVTFLLMCSCLLIFSTFKHEASAPTTNVESSALSTTIEETITTAQETYPPTVRVITEEYYYLTEEEFELIALVVMAEAEGEPELGKRLVIDTILNRVDHKEFPNTVHDVIYYPNAFEAMWNGRVDRCEVRDDIVELVREELKSRSNYHVLYFRTDRFSDYGTPMFKLGNHCFSEY